jgi:ATP-binding cassette subfamily F protein 3
MIITLENISKHYSGECVLNNVALTIDDTDRIGLIGINGCGKSTLLRIITGAEFPDTQPEPVTAKIHKSAAKNIGFLAQDSGLYGDSSIIEAMKGVFAELLGIAARLHEIRDGNLTEECAEEYSAKTAYFESNDGYLIDVKIEKVLRGMGFPPETYSRVISTLSGGERTRLALAKLLLENPALLILDEPTNHLDFDTVLWLEDYLKDYKGALLIVSHDRYFLDKSVTSVCEIEGGILRRFKGNYSAFASQKELFVEQRMKEYEAQAAEIAKLRDYIARNKVRASTAGMAQSRAKQLEKLEASLIQRPITRKKSAVIRYEYDREPPKELLTVKGIDLTVGNNPETGKTLIDSLTLEVRRGERLAVVGANGIGKSTLLKVLQRKHPHSRGTVEWGENTKISYFEQTNTEIFDPQDTVINAVHKLHPRMTELQVRSLLGGVRLTGEDVYKRVADISGGEKAKLRMAIMTLERGNVLILDEPTNHLDISTRDVLEAALCDYTGTIIFVSHDRYLLNKLATRVSELTAEGANSYKSFAEFAEFAASRRQARQAPAKAVEPKPQSDNSHQNGHGHRHRTKEQRAAETQKRVQQQKLEAEIQRLESLLSELQTDMENPEVFSDYALMQEKYALYEEAKVKLADYTDEWLINHG